MYVVEPRDYAPSTHTQVFRAVLKTLLSPAQLESNAFERRPANRTGERFDLITFPEAFLPASDLISDLPTLSQHPSIGCIHVGLRPTNTNSSHLFRVSEIETLLTALLGIPEIEKHDLDGFTAWLSGQDRHKSFNIACLFTVDTKRKLRVCVHAKLQRSKFEFSALEEEYLEECTHLSVVTLKPTDTRLLTLSIQPLICSDTLLQSTDAGGSRPLEAVHSEASCLGDSPPDHIDLVSVAACTPQDDFPGEKPYRVWKTAFKDAFQSTLTDAALSRHRFSTFVLSNFAYTPTKDPAGLSGAFYPLKPVQNYPSDICYSCWGKPKTESDPRWSKPGEDVSTWNVHGHIASVDPRGGGADGAVRMFGFTFTAMPRDMSRLTPPPAIGNCRVRIGAYIDNDSIAFDEASNG